MYSENIIIKTALQTIDIEARTLRRLKKSIDLSFVECVEAIYASSGRLIVTGVGKSALIAQKIVATLNSTGTPSIFMHAADAIHGDLGMIRSADLVLCLSKSGETAEIKVLVPLVKHLGSKLIGMVGKRKSYLGTQADFLLYTPITEEADPNNLAPTASTTAQIAMGDALATSLLALRGFSPSDFAQFHPGGSLGKQMYLRVQDIYPHNEAPAVNASATLQEVILEITAKCLGGTAVLDAKSKLLGIITDGDLRRMLKKKPRLDHLQARDIMSDKPKTIPHDALAVKAMEILRRHSITQLIVLKEEQYVGMVHLHDLVKEGLV